MPIVHLDNISFVRQDTPILSGASWTIEPGEHCALLDANGSDKITLKSIDDQPARAGCPNRQYCSWLFAGIHYGCTKKSYSA